MSSISDEFVLCFRVLVGMGLQKWRIIKGQLLRCNCNCIMENGKVSHPFFFLFFFLVVRYTTLFKCKVLCFFSWASN